MAARQLAGPAITDVAGEPASQTQVERLVARYLWAADYCEDRVVLEVACGTGQGLGLLSSRARQLYACDLSRENLDEARRTYGLRMALIQADGQVLPFADQSVDVVILLETIYFLPSADAFLAEARRVLRHNGCCLVSAINKDCPDFNPNHPRYFERYGAPELARKFREKGFDPECFGMIPMDQPSLRHRALKPIKQLAIRLNLIPDSMQARRYLKRLVFGRLQPMPRDITLLEDHRVATRPLPSCNADSIHQVVLCAGLRN